MVCTVIDVYFYDKVVGANGVVNWVGVMQCRAVSICHRDMSAPLQYLSRSFSNLYPIYT